MPSISGATARFAVGFSGDDAGAAKVKNIKDTSWLLLFVQVRD